MKKGLTMFTWVRPRATVLGKKFLYLTGTHRHLRIGLDGYNKLFIVVNKEKYPTELYLDPEAFNFIALSISFKGNFFRNSIIQISASDTISNSYEHQLISENPFK